MRILLVSSSSGSQGGGELYLLYLGQGLKAQGHDVALWCSDHSSLDALAEQFAATGEVLRAPYVNTYRRPLRALHDRLPLGGHQRWARSWEAWKPDIIHLNKQCIEDGLDLLAAAAATEVPHLCTIHISQTQASLGSVLGGLRDRIAHRYLTRYTGQLLAISETRQQELQAFVEPALPVACIDNGVELPAGDERHDLRAQGRLELLSDAEAGAFVVVSVGRLNPQKRPLLFVERARALRERHPGALFFWVGDGSLRGDFEAAIRKHGAGDYIRCLGWKRDVRPYLAAADLYLHPAAFEGLPFALLEAMAWRLPCVIEPELARELSFLTADEIIVTDDDSWLARADDEEERARLAASGQDLIRRRFSREEMVRRYEALYASLLQRAANRPAA